MRHLKKAKLETMQYNEMKNNKTKQRETQFWNEQLDPNNDELLSPPVN